MSEWTTIRDDIETPFIDTYEWLDSTPAAQALEAGYKAAVTELKTLGPLLLSQILSSVTTAATSAIGNGTDAALEAGEAVILPALEQAGQTLTKSTVSALAAGVVATLNTTPATAS